MERTGTWETLEYYSLYLTVFYKLLSLNKYAANYNCVTCISCKDHVCDREIQFSRCSQTNKNKTRNY